MLQERGSHSFKFEIAIAPCDITDAKRTGAEITPNTGIESTIRSTQKRNGKSRYGLARDLYNFRFRTKYGFDHLQLTTQ